MKFSRGHSPIYAIFFCILFQACHSHHQLDLKPNDHHIYFPTNSSPPGFQPEQRTAAVLTLLQNLHPETPGVARNGAQVTVDGKIQPYLLVPENLLETLAMMFHQAENMDSVEIVFSNLVKRGFQPSERGMFLERLSESWRDRFQIGLNSADLSKTPWATSFFESLSIQSQVAVASYLYEELAPLTVDAYTL